MHDAPLPLCRVLEEEFVSIHGGAVAPYDWTIGGADIADVQSIAADLQRAWHVDDALRAAFARTAHAMLGDAPAASLKEIVAAELTALLGDATLVERLAQALEVPPDPAITDDEPLQRNRLRLEGIFPYALARIYDRRLEALYANVHQREQAALCLSGGGIRSATFALGILQGLAHHNLLNNFHYLSTVSGGGFIGSWLSSWIAHHRNGIQGVSQELQQRGASKLEPEPAPIHHLRTYSNYLTPQIGLFSGDTWALLGTYARNATMNLLIVLPLLFAAVLLPRLMVATMFEVRESPGAPRGLLVAAVVLGAVAITYLMYRRPSVERIDSPLIESRALHKLQGQRWFFTLSLLPLFVAAVCAVLYWSAVQGAQFPMWQFAAFGFVMQLGGMLGILRLQGMRALVELPLFIASSLLGGAMLYLLTLLPVSSPPLLATIGPPLFLLNFLGAATIYIAALSRTKYSFDEDLEWWARTGGWTLLFAAAWLVACGVVLYGPVAVLRAPKWYAAGAGTVIAATLTVIRWLRSLLSRGAARDEKTTTLNAALNWLAPACFLLIVLVLTFVASRVTFLAFPVRLASAEDFRKLHEASLSDVVAPQSLFILFGALVAIGLFFSWLVDINRFSMHAMYRNRLTRAYLGASRARRRPNPFTGFDPADSREMHELGPESFDQHSFYDFIDLVEFFRRPKKESPAGRLLRRIRRLDWHTHRGLTNRQPGQPLSPELARRFVRVLNQLIRDPDLATALTGEPGAEQPGPPLHRANRRRLEAAFPEHIVPIEYTTTFSGDTIIDAERFLAQLSKSPLFAPELRAQWRTRDLDGIIRDVDALLHDESLYDAARRAGIELDSTIVSLAESKPAGGDAVILNRLILEAAFPRVLRRWRSTRPFHVVNTALNLVQGEDLAWQERKAESFTLTPLHAGAGRLGFRRSHRFGDRFGFSLPTAVTISGAAASPSMGFQTSTTIALLMTLFNVRLGWWFGNPGPWGAKTYRRSSPRWSLIRILQEALGLTNDRRSYVYLSDGGHFENLGLYEMVRRRCKLIVVSDAGQDYRYAFQDLGNAVRKIRVDLGIPIEIKDHRIFPRDENKLGKYCAVGDIVYGAVDKGAANGTLIYLKPALYWREPMDVYNYGRENVEFPHEPTSDQFFGESQFESYRMLGQHTIDAICEQREWRAKSLQEFAERAEEYLQQTE